MWNQKIDRRVIQILRWSIIVQIVFLLLSSFSPRLSLREGQFIFADSDYLSLISIALMAVILILIWLPSIEQHLTRRAFLAILYSIALITIFSRHIFSLTIGRLIPNASPGLFRWDAIFFLIIPLVFIAWQFPLKHVIYYAFVVLLADFLPSLFDPNRVNLVAFNEMLDPKYKISIIINRPDVDIIFMVADFMGSFARSVILVIVGWVENSLVTVQRSQHTQLVEANVKLQKYALTSEKLAQTQERNRLARELHDTLAHTLSSNSVQLEAVKALFDRNPEEAKRMLTQTLESTKKGLKETRRALVDLRSSELEAYGLTQAIRNMVSSAAERGGFKTEFHLEKGLDMLPDEISHSLYRIIQEAVENILRHSNATDVGVSLFSQGKQIKLIVADNGRGFDLNNIQKDHLGIRGMRERIEMLGGTFEVVSNVNHGTQISILIEMDYDQDHHL